MKKLSFTVAILLGSTGYIYSQAPYWKLNGNPAIGPDLVNGANNFFGTTLLNNIPVRQGTNGSQRIYINNTAGGVLGSVGIGNLFSAGFIPRSMLHIAQDNGIATIGGGLRNWMQPTANGTFGGGTGMLMSNGDNVWLGLRNKGGTWDANDAILDWGDNGGPGTDFFRFVLTHWNIGGAPGGTTDGLEIMRFDPNSYVGIGDFQVNGKLNPQSKLHIHEDIYLQPGGTRQSVWFQMTNEDFAQANNLTGNRGLRIGLLQQGVANNDARTGNAFIYNQESRHLIFSTGKATPTSINTTHERIRLTYINAPTNLLGGGYGVFNPANFTGNDTTITRVSISEQPNLPVVRPMSLLHMGYDSPDVPNSGWRKWMDIGTYSSGFFDQMYVGLKEEGVSQGFQPNVRMDAVLNWGRDNSTTPILGPDNMRFIFTKNGGSTPPAVGAQSLNGIEGIRLTPTTNDSAVYTGIGGDPVLNKYYLNSINPTLTLEVNSPALTDSAIYSGMRFTDMTAKVTPLTNPGLGLLALDTSGKVIYVKGGGAGIGNLCGAAVTNPLTANYEVPLGGFNYFFSGSGAMGTNTLNVGVPCSFPNFNAKVRAVQSTSFPGGTQTGVSYAGQFMNWDADPAFSTTNRFTGVKGLSSPALNPNSSSLNAYLRIGVDGEARHAKYSYGVLGTAHSHNSGYQIGGVFKPNTSTVNQSSFSAGLYSSSGNSTTSLGNFAAFFNGNITQGLMTLPSDESIKRDIVPISNALSILTQLNPVSFKYDTAFANTKGLYLPGEKNYGFKAGELATVLPELVYDTKKPDDLDTTGNIIYPEYTYKAINYFPLIGILTAGIQEQQLSIDSLRNRSDSTSAQNGLSINSGSVVLGNDVGQTSAQLTSDREVPLSNHKISFTGDGFIGIGTSADATNTLKIGGRTAISANTYAGGIPFVITNPSGTILNVRDDGRIQTGVLNATADIGNWNGSSLYHTFRGFNSSTNPCVIFDDVTGTQIMTVWNHGRVGIGTGTSGPAATFEVNGTIFASGTITSSDSTLKTNITPMGANAMAKVKALRPVSYEWITKRDTGMYGTHYGFTAQQVETVIPDLVKTDSAGKKSLAYSEIIPFLTKAMQEQQSKIDSLTAKVSEIDSIKQQMAQLAALINSCCSNNVRTINSSVSNLDVELSDKDAITLSQNSPNPFAEHTLIQYNIPENRGYAQIIFSDLKGQIIKVVDIKTKGRGQLNVFANDLSTGMYTYSLYVDGKLFETKKMVKTE